MRHLIAAAAALALAGCPNVAALGAPPPPPAPLAPSQPLVLAGPTEVRISEVVARIRQIDPQLHSIIAIDPTAVDQAKRVDLARLSGPLAGSLMGQPVLIKDNIEVAGTMPTTAGSLALANNVTNRDAPLVARLRSAGAIILGKTNLSEWANIRSNNSISGWSAVGGQVRNPWALDRNPWQLERQRRRGRGRPRPPRHRHRDRRVDHLPGSDQRHRRVETDGRVGQPDAHRADQP